MIAEKCFEKDWIENFKNNNRYKRINPPLLEKMIYAFYLLLNLRNEGLDFIFKGGTCLVLLLENSNRFSIDIDIITRHSREEIELILNSIIQNSKFDSWKLDQRRSYKNGVPKAHYEFEFISNFNPNNIILLDILFETNLYPNMIEIPIKTIWFQTNGLIKTYTPDIDSIIGDKLTAFAPNTTGILYETGKSIEIIKQLFDLNNLFDNISSILIVSESFNRFAKKELNYRSLNLNSNEILIDIIHTAKLLAVGENNKSYKKKYDELKNGVSALNNYLIVGNFRLHNALEASSKIAYLATILLTKQFEQFTILRLNDQNYEIIKDDEWNFLNKLRKLPNNLCVEYWKKTIKLLKENGIDL